MKSRRRRNKSTSGEDLKPVATQIGPFSKPLKDPIQLPTPLQLVKTGEDKRWNVFAKLKHVQLPMIQHLEYSRIVRLHMFGHGPSHQQQHLSDLKDSYEESKQVLHRLCSPSTGKTGSYRLFRFSSCHYVMTGEIFIGRPPLSPLSPEISKRGAFIPEMKFGVSSGKIAVDRVLQCHRSKLDTHFSVVGCKN